MFLSIILWIMTWRRMEETGEGKNYARGFLVLTSDRLGILLSDHQGLKDSRSLFMWVRACVHERSSLSLSPSLSRTHAHTRILSLTHTNALTHTSVYNTALQRKREKEKILLKRKRKEKWTKQGKCSIPVKCGIAAAAEHCNTLFDERGEGIGKCKKWRKERERECMWVREW